MPQADNEGAGADHAPPQDRDRGASAPHSRGDLPDELHTLACELAREASRIHLEGLAGALDVSTKSTPNDFVSDVDRRAEARIVTLLAAARPGDAILGEEGTARAGDSGLRWIVDPLDGTTNYVYGYPAFCSSIAVERDGETVAAAVSESLTGTVFSAVRGKGAWCGEQSLRVRSPAALSAALVATGFSYDARQRRQQGQVMARLLQRVGDIRRSGSAALDLCRLAAGQVDAYFELDLSPWDYAGGRLIAQEAGARVLELPAAHGKGPAIVAAGPALIEPLVEALREAGALAT
jgi:myo-inositol-1(or 4)-monophosphatase